MLGKVCAGLVLLICLSGTSLFYLYQVVESGELVLDHAPGLVRLSREQDTKIIHIKGDDWESVAYA